MKISVELEENEVKVLRDALVLYQSVCARTCSCSKPGEKLGEEFFVSCLLTKKLGL